MCDALIQYGGINSGDDALVLLSADEGNYKASAAPNECCHFPHIFWSDIGGENRFI